MSDGPDLNPRDNSLWDILGADVCVTYHPNLELLKKSSVKKAIWMPLEAVHTAISQCSTRLAKYIVAEGGHFD